MRHATLEWDFEYLASKTMEEKTGNEITADNAEVSIFPDRWIPDMRNRHVTKQVQ